MVAAQKPFAHLCRVNFESRYGAATIGSGRRNFVSES
jgi:hypothetical protein